MRPKKLKTSEASSSTVEENQMLNSVSKLPGFCDRSLIFERHFKLEKGSNSADYEVKKQVDDRGWDNFCCGTPIEVNDGIVREFYSNFPKKVNDKVKVRNKEVPIGIDAINRCYGLKTLEEDEYVNFASKEQDMDMNMITDEICMTPPTWEMNAKGKPLKFNSNFLTPTCNMWFRFTISRFIPKKQQTHVTCDRAILLYCIVKGMKIDVGKLIHRQMLLCVNKNFEGLWFPSLITKLCLDVKVKENKMDHKISRVSEITYKSLLVAKVHRREPQRLEVDIDTHMRQVEQQQQEPQRLELDMETRMRRVEQRQEAFEKLLQDTKNNLMDQMAASEQKLQGLIEQLAASEKYHQEVMRHQFLMMEALGRMVHANCSNNEEFASYSKFPDYPDQLNPHLPHQPSNYQATKLATNDNPHQSSSYQAANSDANEEGGENVEMDGANNEMENQPEIYPKCPDYLDHINPHLPHQSSNYLAANLTTSDNAYQHSSYQGVESINEKDDGVEDIDKDGGEEFGKGSSDASEDNGNGANDVENRAIDENVERDGANNEVENEPVWWRNGYDDFIRFCFERFTVAVWSSRQRHNLVDIIESLFKGLEKKLLFIWDQSDCESIPNDGPKKCTFLKELKKVWYKHKQYNESNTLLIDDSPEKAVKNPSYTAIFPRTYTHSNVSDNSLGPQGDLRQYLERLNESENVQDFVMNNQFGQSPIADISV